MLTDVFLTKNQKVKVLPKNVPLCTNDNAYIKEYRLDLYGKESNKIEVTAHIIYLPTSSAVRIPRSFPAPTDIPYVEKEFDSDPLFSRYGLLDALEDLLYDQGFELVRYE